MLIEKIKLFFAKHKILTIIVLAILAIDLCILCVSIYYKNCSNVSEEIKGVAGTLLGAIVGGGFTLMGSLVINKNAQKATNAIKRKNVIYKPLYDELTVIHNDILIENPYPHFIRFEIGPQTIIRHPQYTVWGRIKNDARLFEVPSKLKKSMEELYTAMKNYLQIRSEAVKALDQIYRNALKEITNREISESSNVGDTLLSYVLTGKRPENDMLIWDWGKSPDVKKDADAVWNSLRKSVKNEKTLKLCVEAKTTWMESEELEIILSGSFLMGR